MVNHKLKVMHIILNLDVGGAQEVVRTLVEHLASDSCCPMVCTFNDGPLRQDIERLGIKVEVVPGRRYSIIALPWFIADIFRIWRTLADLVKKYEIDVVQTHLLASLDFLILLLQYTTRLRVVLWTFHSANFVLTEAELPKYRCLLKPKRYLYHQLYHLASNLVSGFIAVSAEVKSAIVEIIDPVQDKITVIYNGVDLRRYDRPFDKRLVRAQLGLDVNARLIIMVGTLKAVKGHRYLIEAMASIIPQYPDVQLLFVGDGELREELGAQVETLGLGQHTHFLGNRHDVPELLAASDLFVLPSLWEGLSMALLEAMATGLPIVASQVSGTVQVVTPNENGLLVPPGDVQKLAEAIEQILSYPAQARKMGATAKLRVASNFSAHKQVSDHLALYYQLLDKTVGLV